MSSATVTPRRSGPVWELLPTGQELPLGQWHARHRGILILLWIHTAVIPLFALARGFALWHAVLEGLIVPVSAVAATSTSLPRRVRTMAASVGLLSASAVLVHMSGGVIEMHFHFFVMVTVVALYQDWLPFLAAIAYVFVHHGLIGALDPDSVFNHRAALEHPWRWAGIHAFFITGISATCLVTWRMNEVALRQRMQAERRLREEARIVEILHQVGTSLAAELELNRVVQLVTDAATQHIDASFGAFFYNLADENGEAYQLFALSGAPEEAFIPLGMPRNTPIFGPTFAGAEIVRLDDVTADARYGQMAPHHGMPEGHLPVRSYLAVPVRGRDGSVLGGLFFGHPEPARFDHVAERIVSGIAAQASISFDNARLYESERQARQLSDAAGKRLELLAEASRALSSSFSVDAILRGLASVVSSDLADYCVVHVEAADGEAIWISAASSADRADRAAEIEARGALSGSLFSNASPSEQPSLVTSIDAGLFGHDVGWAPSDRIASAILAPLLGRQERLGTVALARTEGSPPFTSDDVAMAGELARRAGIALEHAMLFARQRTVALTLQHSLLPERLPVIAGLESAARYHAGGPGVDVGGDWYDALQLANGSVFLAMGDVVGRGERAAALMGQLRNAARAFAMDGWSPGPLLGRLNDFQNVIDPGDMATMVCALFDPATSELTVASAGHPSPIVISRTGSTVLLPTTNGPPIGVAARSSYQETIHTLEPGTAVLLYTDGLIEAPDLPLDKGLARLCEAVAGEPTDVDDLCDRATAGLVANQSDDVAVLAVRVLPLTEHLRLRLPTDPSTLLPLRITMRRWLIHVGATIDEVDEILLALGEACANCIRHTRWLGCDFYEVDASAGEDVRISIHDTGGWRTPRDAGGGRGLGIIDSFMDDVEIEKRSDGTTVLMRRRLLNAARNAVIS